MVNPWLFRKIVLSLQTISNINQLNITIMTFEEAKQKSVSCVYCMEFPNGKKYVGKTKNLSKRLALCEKFDGVGGKALDTAINEFGLSAVSVTVLSEVKCANRVDLELCLSILEVKYIRELGTTDADKGYNVSFGGEVLGIPIEYLTTDKDAVNAYNTGCKAILLYDENGDFVKEYPSIAMCAYDNGWDEESVRNAVGRSSLFYGRYFVRVKRYDYVPLKMELPKGYEVCERVKYKTRIEEVVVTRERKKYVFVGALKYDMNGDFCGEYASKSEALRTFTKSGGVIWGKYHKGYILFKKKDDDYPTKIEPYHVLSKKITKEYYVPADQLEDIPVINKADSFDDVKKVTPRCVNGKYTNIKHQFKVYQYTLGGEFVTEYASIRDAAHDTGINYAQIYNCLRGATKKAAGYLWKKEE